MSTKRTRALTLLACGGLLVLTFGVPDGQAAKDLSDKSVRLLMAYAWGITPNKFTYPSGKTVTVDRAKPKQSMVPLDDARRIIKIGRLSAHAERCSLTNALLANFKTLVRTETKSKKWSEQQLLYIRNLHNFTVGFLNGNVKLIHDPDSGEKKVVFEAPGIRKADTCTDAEKNKISKLIGKYICEVDPKSVEGCS